MMNIFEFGRYVPYSEEPTYSPIMRMESRLERFAVGEVLSFGKHTPQYLLHDTCNDCAQYLRKEMVKRLADIGLLIPDSVSVEIKEKWDFERTESRYFEYHVVCRANALMPTSTGEKEPRRHYCEHCTSTAFEDQYHSGTCENCGAPFKRGTFHGSGV